MTGKLAVVFGGSGFIGRNVVRELAKRGWRVRVGVRRPHLANFLRPLGGVGQIQLAQVNVRFRPSVAEALKDADAVVNLVGLMNQEGAQNFDSVQAGGSAAIAQLSREAGIKNFIQVSAIGADPKSDSDYARTKGAAEAAAHEAIPTATIVRPSIVFGLEDKFFNRFAMMAQYAPALPLIGGGKTKLQPIYVDDVADAICNALADDETQGKTYEVGGPITYTFRELIDFILRETGRQRALIPIPFPVASLLGLGGEIVGWAPFISAPLTRDQVKLLKHDNVVGEGVLAISDLGVQPQTVESIVPSYMVRYRRYGQFAERPA